MRKPGAIVSSTVARAPARTVTVVLTVPFAPCNWTVCVPAGTSFKSIGAVPRDLPSRSTSAPDGVDWTRISPAPTDGEDDEDEGAVRRVAALRGVSAATGGAWFRVSSGLSPVVNPWSHVIAAFVVPLMAGPRPSVAACRDHKSDASDRHEHARQLARRYWRRLHEHLWRTTHRLRHVDRLGARNLCGHRGGSGGPGVLGCRVAEARHLGAHFLELDAAPPFGLGAHVGDLARQPCVGLGLGALGFAYQGRLGDGTRFLGGCVADALRVGLVGRRAACASLRTRSSSD